MEYKRCGIIGYGKIGESIGCHLIQKGVKPLVYDKISTKQIRAYNRMCEIDKKNNIIKKCDVIFLATGNHSLNINDFRNIKNGTYIFSVTSSDDEIDNSYLEDEYEVFEVDQHIYKYSNENNRNNEPITRGGYKNTGNIFNVYSPVDYIDKISVETNSRASLVIIKEE